MFIILAVDRNIFKLQLYNECDLKVHTLSFNFNKKNALVTSET